jgi:hypothetical protein
MDICLSPARAAASRRNGAKSRGPKTSEGKERSSQNALKHGLRAQKFLVVGDEKPKEFDAFEAALVDELAPEGALQSLLARRIARAAWRLERAERIEADLFERHTHGNASLGLALIRDGNGTRAFDTLLRYRGSALAELWRAVRLLKALQAEAHAHDAAPEKALEQVPERPPGKPSEPEARRIPGEIAPEPAVEEAEAVQAAAGDAARPSGRGSTLAPVPRAPEMPIEPEGRGNAGRFDTVPSAGTPASCPERERAAAAARRMT